MPFVAAISSPLISMVKELERIERICREVWISMVAVSGENFDSSYVRIVAWEKSVACSPLVLFFYKERNSTFDDELRFRLNMKFNEAKLWCTVETLILGSESVLEDPEVKIKDKICHRRHIEEGDNRNLGQLE